MSSETRTGERVPPGDLPEFIAREADGLYEAIQEAENRAYRLFQALDWQLAEDKEPETRKRRMRARLLHRRIFQMLEATERVSLENDEFAQARRNDE